GVVSESSRRIGRGACGQAAAGDNVVAGRDRMKWTDVESSAFQAAAYAERQALLYLLFRSGELYRYFGHFRLLREYARSSEKFMHGMKVLMAKNFIDNLSEETHKGMLE